MTQLTTQVFDDIFSFIFPTILISSRHFNNKKNKIFFLQENQSLNKKFELIKIK